LFLLAVLWLALILHYQLLNNVARLTNTAGTFQRDECLEGFLVDLVLWELFWQLTHDGQSLDRGSTDLLVIVWQPGGVIAPHAYKGSLWRLRDIHQSP
jgi:hypothetical protein